jgi:hypothetical protein
VADAAATIVDEQGAEPRRPSLTGEWDGHQRQPDPRWGRASQVRPWVRYFARGIDNGLILALGHLVYVPTDSWGKVFYYYVALPVAAFTLYPLQLVLFGRTIGKAYFGVSVENEQGRRPTLRQAVAREWGVLVDGMGVGLFIVPLLLIYAAWWRLSRDDMKTTDVAIALLVPLFFLAVGIVVVPAFTMFAGYRRLKADGVTSWDRPLGLVVRHRPAKIRVAIFTMANIVLAVGMAAAAKRSNPPQFPPGRQPPPAMGPVVVAPPPAPEPVAGERAVAKKSRGKPKVLTLESAPPGSRPARGVIANAAPSQP